MSWRGVKSGQIKAESINHFRQTQQPDKALNNRHEMRSQLHNSGRFQPISVSGLVGNEERIIYHANTFWPVPHQVSRMCVLLWHGVWVCLPSLIISTLRCRFHISAPPYSIPPPRTGHLLLTQQLKHLCKQGVANVQSLILWTLGKITLKLIIQIKNKINKKSQQIMLQEMDP